jgi:hypothetical protein
MSHARAVPVGHAEPHGGGMATRLNWLRAAVLGANDGIVSTAGLVVRWPAQRRPGRRS